MNRYRIAPPARVCLYVVAAVRSTMAAGFNAIVNKNRFAARRLPAGLLIGLLLSLSACAPYREASQSQACQLVVKARVPVTLHQGRIIVSASLNGRPVRMMVDTGASISTIEPHIAESIGGTYNRDRLVHINGVGGRSDAQRPYKVKTIQMGPLNWFDFEVMVVDVAGAKKRADPEAVAGIIGADLLRWYDIEFDFQRGEMTFHRSPNCRGHFVPWEKPYEVAHSPPDRRRFFIIPVELNGRTLRALVDTGAGATLVHRSAALAAGADPAMLEQGKKTTAAGIVGLEAPAYAYRFDTVTIAGKKFANRPLLVSNAVLSDGIDMLLGMDFWWQHRMWLSYQTGQVFMQQISLQKPKSPAPSPTIQPGEKTYE